MYFVTRIVIPVIGHCVISTSMKLLLILDFLITNVKKRKKERKKKRFYKRFLNVGNEKTVLEREGERDRQTDRDRDRETHTQGDGETNKKMLCIKSIQTSKVSFGSFCIKSIKKKEKKKVPVR